MKISIINFEFRYTGYGHYKVTYTSPVTNKKWTTTTADMSLIDSTKNSDNPTQNNLKTLKKLCKK
jgi:hypothetical protein